ncbi:galactose metabolism- protein [Exophiala dermatitidis]|uniref:5'-AMP-activated protein kinase, regulatory beta subunit n=2 Tax=Exophiala dermatitidis TaxID=5970 RepID=H6BQC8_EXODN|nr:5'-AMP-activated protein kinase, regulatory beta subunit [Exophiala dermatitidis NIH/UT8656]KAJ4511605.1 galactose metabolism- protein [Exophiala dermatitidis]EHY54521.1 5'-AMP-activated protein kinase, regulatory beta subunit [Exophiala dermatitidis NIH/UT8656]KAJ4517683.1 galactose metabolism- protein [Exophiala dermatitidis]KAJ4521338.1 galactose metabolism- protein [Exophiala dermatitidis]KAJ4542006.1 galactose metabolism- protein [Exophiala dermatitidis]
MGQQQSSEKGSSSRTGTPQAERDRKVSRRVSIQALSQSRATPVDPSATKDTAVAQTTSQHLDKPDLQQYLQASSSPDQQARAGKVERSSSRASRAHRNELEQRPKQQPSPAPAPPQASGPMDVPASRSKQESVDEPVEEPNNTYHDRRYTPVAQLRPPRLPLPIADVPIPESPTLLPVDRGNADVPIFETDEPLSAIEPQTTRKSSMLSTTTQSEEEVGEELQPFAVDTATAQTVPTVIEWNHGGNKVYVTGTFANWEKKYRLHPRKNGPGMFTTINLPSGTHHLKFVVDGEMVTSPDLPTAVDFNNFLVNYIEVATEDLTKPRRESAQTGSKSSALAAVEHEHGRSGTHTPVSEMGEPQAEEIPEGDFRQLVPQALLDIDLPEDDHRYHNAVRVIQESPAPPALPLFLSRSILNGVLPVKDDNSVLTLPNHTVLNHLMTSSVKNGVLATSVTTRYKKKYVTTISFKPVPQFQTAQ